MSRFLTIDAWCIEGALPESTEFYSTFVEQDHKFTEIEGQNWDFKENWPTSHKSEYFGGVCRLVCAFANTTGGVLIFGVHDKYRTGGHNPTKPALDSFFQAFHQLTESEIEFDFRRYSDEKSGPVDVLLIQPRRHGVKPLRFVRSIEKYAAGQLWVRSGNEVQRAAPRHFSGLFCRARADIDVIKRDGSLPPSPATMNHFVGRVEVLDRLFSWLEGSQQPRIYLHGKGGSGKTTIAYEFARLVRDFGEPLRIGGEDQVDIVLFLSAKEKALIPTNGTVEILDNPDFSDERTLLVEILYFSGWTSDKSRLNELDLEDLRREVSELLDVASLLIVIDDIDTLTTKGIDPGADSLFAIMSRSKRRSKVLYTLRNAPSQSLNSSIDVPGLKGDEYDTFVSRCAEQFRVPEPQSNFKNERLPLLSERRPLVIEVIIALVRTARTYERAADLFSQNAGENARDYVFSREWDSLGNDRMSRLLLAALANLNRPSTFEDIKTVLQADDSTILDAIGSIREMFLQIDTASDDPTYTIAPLTRSFINSKKIQLKGYDVLSKRVAAFKRTVRITSPEVAAICAKIHRLLPLRYREHDQAKLMQAWTTVNDPSLPPVITEDPVFKSALGYVCASRGTSFATEARESFQYAIDMHHEPLFGELVAWFIAERDSGVFDEWCGRIADTVINGRTYSEAEKIEMISRKASSMYARGKDRMYTNPTDAIGDFKNSLVLNLRAFKLNSEKGDTRTELSEQLAENASRVLFDLISRSDEPWRVFDHLHDLLKRKDVFLDPLETPVKMSLAKLRQLSTRPNYRSRFKSGLVNLPPQLLHREKWLDANIGKSLAEAVVDFESALRSSRPQ